MLTLTTWFLVVVLSGAAVIGMLHLAEATDWQRGRVASIPRKLLSGVLAGIVLGAMAFIWQIRGVAVADGHIIRELALSRGSTLTHVMSVVTTMGDAIPTLTIASVIALVIYCTIRPTWMVVLIPLAVLVELAVQVAMSKVFDVVTAADVVPGLVEGGAGSIPSGSVARLFSLCLVAAHICATRDRRVARRMVTLGAVLVLVQTVTRVYLSRHLMGDIVGGMVLGVALERFGAAVVAWNEGRGGGRHEAMEEPPTTAFEDTGRSRDPKQSSIK